MKTWTFEELHAENEKNALGLQYTIAERERLKTLAGMIGDRLSANNIDVMKRIIETIPSTKAERFQDLFALLFTGCKENGFFVEFGACDGLAANNTYTLEQNFGWKGILAEPDAFWHERLLQNRHVKIDTRCVSTRSGEKIEFHRSDKPGNSSTHRDHPYIGGVVDSYLVETVSLQDLLRQHDAPKFIEFLSIDTEGHEKEALSNFDFDEYKFGFICVEEHEQVSDNDSVQPILEAAGYRVVLPREKDRPVPMQITGVDKFFVPG